MSQLAGISPNPFINPEATGILGADGKPIRPLRENASLVPVTYSFAGLVNLGTRSISWRWDEAYRQSPQSAKAMERDPWLMGLLFERLYNITQSAWHIEPEDPEDPQQKEQAQLMGRIVKRIPRFSDYLWKLAWADWWGRAAVQQFWGKKFIKGQPRYTVTGHFQVRGDKIQYSFDGTPRILIYAGPKPEMHPQGAKLIRITDRTQAIELAPQDWRDAYAIHKGWCIDADFFQPDEIGSLWGVGIRHFVYWFDWLKKEIQSWLTDYMERTGLGLTIYYYDESNPAGVQQAQQAAKQDGRNTVIVWPRSSTGKDVGPGIERIETSTQGAEIIIKMMEYFDDKIERFIVGQAMSGGKDAGHSLGGTGRALISSDTKYRVIKNGSQSLGETLSEDLLNPMARYNRIPDYGYKLVFDLDQPAQQEKVEAAKALWEMGIELKKAEVRGKAGFSEPQEGDDVLEGAPDPLELAEAETNNAMKIDGEKSKNTERLENAKASNQERLEKTKAELNGGSKNGKPSNGKPQRYEQDRLHGGEGWEQFWDVVNYQTAPDVEERIAEAAAETDTDPTSGQVHADTFKRGHVSIHGLRIAIQNPKGSDRIIGDHHYKAVVKMKFHYGQIIGYPPDNDDAPVDVFLGPHPKSELVFVIDQMRPDGVTLDEHKACVGWHNAASARSAYEDSHPPEWTFAFGGMKAFTIDEFKEWLSDAKAHGKPVSYQNEQEPETASIEAVKTQSNGQREVASLSLEDAARFTATLFRELDSPDDPEEYADDCNWVTIPSGGEGGSPVCIKPGGEVAKGPAALKGKDLSKTKTASKEKKISPSREGIMREAATTPAPKPKEVKEAEKSLRQAFADYKQPTGTAEQRKHAMRGEIQSKTLINDDNENSVFRVVFADGSHGAWKPADGEEPGLRTNVPQGTYYKREAAAYEVASLLGFDFVPATVIRDVDGRQGSMQDWTNGTAADLVDDRDAAFDGPEMAADAAVFDYIIGNTDRHWGNWMLTPDKKLALIDHGLAFPTAYTGKEDDERRMAKHNALLGHSREEGMKVPNLRANWDQVESVLRAGNIEPEAIELTKQRFEAVQGAAGKPFSELPIGASRPTRSFRFWPFGAARKAKDQTGTGRTDMKPSEVERFLKQVEKDKQGNQ